MIPAAFVLLSAGWVYFSFPNIVFVQGAPFLSGGCVLFLLHVLDRHDIRERFFYGLIWGFAVNGLLVSWLFSVSPGGWFVLTLALAMQGVIFAVFFPSRSSSNVLKLFLIPCVWVFSEWVRTLLLGGFCWSLGYALSPLTPFLWPAAWAGVYALAWLIVFINTALYVMLYASRHRFLFLAGAVIALCVWGGLGSWQQNKILHRPNEGRRVAVVQPNIPNEQKMKESLYDVNITRHLELTTQAVMSGRLGPEDLVVWPETAFTDDVLADMKWRPRLEMAARNFHTSLLVGSALLWDGYDLNSALLLSFDGKWSGVYHKMRLVPFVEFTPAAAKGLAKFFRIGKYSFVAGDRPGIMSLPGGQKFGVAICSEEFYPDIFRHLAAEDPEFIVVMLNDGWFSRREALLMHALAAPVRAVETGRAVVRSANTGMSGVFDLYGRQTGRTVQLQRPDVVIYGVPGPARKVFYSQWGDVFAVICFAFVIMTYTVVGIKQHEKTQISEKG